MYKVLIVDDEMLARVGIMSLIKWEENEFAVVGQADNGRTALEMTVKHGPDIIITDIRMPVMDGIELIEAVKKKNMDCEFIVISSHDDFDYVKKAMKLGVEDYILKLEMETGALLEVLETVKAKIKKRRSEKWDKDNIQAYRNFSEPLVREKFIKKLLFEGVEDEIEFRNTMSFIELELYEKGIASIGVLVERGNYGDRNEEDDFVMNATVHNTLTNALDNFKGVCLCQINPMEYNILVSGMNDYLKETQDIIDRLKRELHKYLNVGIIASVSKKHNGYDQIHLAYSEVKEIQNTAYSYPVGSVVYYGRTEDSKVDEVMEEVQACLKSLESGFAEGLDKEIEVAFDTLILLLKESRGLSAEQLRSICSTCIYLIKSHRETTHVDIKDVFGEDRPYRTIERMMLLDDYIGWFETVKSNVMKKLADNSDVTVQIVRAKRYMAKNYMDEGISLEVVASHLNLSSNYFSTLFKSETGTNYSDYIISLRINEAKRLLKATDDKVNTIAMKVGYSNIHYFSRIFKKVVGVSPNQYRNM